MLKSAIRSLNKFVSAQSLGGIVLFLSALLAIFINNSGLHTWYDFISHLSIGIEFGDFQLKKPLLLWVNDGLMAIFFLLVGLELKREILEGHLASKQTAILPIIAALGGIIVPAIIFYFCNYSNLHNLKGWAIPTATDIAFALGILSLLGSRVTSSMKVFLLALAIFDDLAAIIIIGLFYTKSLSLMYLLHALIVLLVLLIFNYCNLKLLFAYLVLGLLLWFLVLKSGIHATIAGVLLAFTIPHSKSSQVSLLKRLENKLHNPVAFFILPIFAFLNAGVSLADINFNIILEPIVLGICLGLFLGKQIGITLFSYLAVKFRLAVLPVDLNFKNLYAVGVIAGIGFTMSLFIGTLAYHNPSELAQMRIGVILGSIFSGLVGVICILATKKA